MSLAYVLLLGKNIEHQPDSSTKTNKENATGHLLISLVNLDQHPKIARDFYVCLSSICKFTSIAITLHIVTDSKSQGKADKVVGQMKKDVCKDKIHVEYHDISFVIKELEPLISVLKVGTTKFRHGSESFSCKRRGV